MFLRLTLVCNLFAWLAFCGWSQTASFQPIVFTWEGATDGNKAVWKADDTLNVYRNIEDIDVTVHLVDPLKLNTTTTNPSEFNDYTKTNTFYGKGNLALQITSTKSKQPVCLEFIFSKPVFLLKFPVFDIDMLQSSSNHYSTYQDSLSFRGFNESGQVPLKLEKLDSTPTFTIYGQSVKANYLAGVNGDVFHTNPKGGINISSQEAIQKFVLYYSNGSEDDGLSNSHALKIPGFDFAELLGRIEGNVFEISSRTPLAGSVLMLVDQNGELVVNKEGFIMQTMTDETGHYSFGFLPMGQYRVVQINPPGYENAGDADGKDDNNISQLLTVSNVISLENDFYERLSIPLAAGISDMYVSQTGNETFRAEWTATSESYNNFFTVFSSSNGLEYTSEGIVSTVHLETTKYNFTFDKPGAYPKLYVKLMQTNADGEEKLVGIRIIRPKMDDLYIDVYPNPATDHVTVDMGNRPEATGYDYFLTDSSHRVMATGRLSGSQRLLSLDLTGLAGGIYFINVLTDKGRFIKQLIVQK